MACEGHCGQQPAVLYCDACQANFCKACHSAPAFLRHTNLSAPRRTPLRTCGEHGQPLQLVCETDGAIVCFHCTHDQHKGHETVLVTARAKQSQAELRRQVEALAARAALLREKRAAVDAMKASVLQVIACCDFFAAFRVYTYCVICQGARIVR